MTESPVLPRFGIIVLMIDDQEIIGEAVRRMLTGQMDIDFHYCNDPTRAIRIANRISPTVILQDLEMPEIDGLRLVRYFRANPGTREVPLIVLSGREEPKTKAEAFALGANDYMVKLPDRLEVIARIRYHSKGYINMLERNEAFGQLELAKEELETKNRELKKKKKELENANKLVKKTFGRYLSQDVVENILESPEKIIGEREVEITIMMTDLRGFTAITQEMEAKDVIRIINIYLEEMTKIIDRYGGNIVEFIGDAILAIFGAPAELPDHAQKAAACAIEMQLAMEKVNKRNHDEGFTEVEQGIGLNTGKVMVGTFGSETRSKFGVVGSSVNLTSRIESFTVGGQTFISRSTHDACGDILRIDDTIEIMPKGVTKPISIYELGGVGEPYNQFMPETREWIILNNPLIIQYAILKGKYTDDVFHEGKIEKIMGITAAEIRSETSLERLANIRFSMFDKDKQKIADDLYAKVTRVFSNNTDLFKITFTSLPAEAERYFKAL